MNIDTEQFPDDLEILEQCLKESEKSLKHARNDKDRAVATMEVMDFRRTIGRLREEKENDPE